MKTYEKAREPFIKRFRGLLKLGAGLGFEPKTFRL